MENNADPNARTAYYWTPLHSACKWNNVECAERLIEAGSDINATTSGGKIYIYKNKIKKYINIYFLGLTPLHLAAELADSHSLIELLLSQPNIKPDVKLPNSTEDTPKDIAGRKSINDRLFEYTEPCFSYL